MNKRFDPAACATEEHFRARDVAKLYHVSLNTARRLMQSHPKCKCLPAAVGRGTIWVNERVRRFTPSSAMVIE